MILTNKNIYLLLQRILRKESRGNVVSVDDFNRLFPVKVRERFENRKKEMERTSDITEDLERYIRVETLSESGDGRYAKPDGNGGEEFVKHLGALKPNGDSYLPVDLITKLEYTSMTSLTKPTERYPVVFYEEGQLVVRPSSVNVEVHYMVAPNVPFLDYHYRNMNIVYLDEGDEVVDDGVNVLKEGSSFPEGNYISETVDSDMSDNDKLAVLYTMLAEYGVTLPDETAIQYGLSREAKHEQL